MLSFVLVAGMAAAAAPAVVVVVGVVLVCWCHGSARSVAREKVCRRSGAASSEEAIISVFVFRRMGGTVGYVHAGHTMFAHTP